MGHTPEWTIEQDKREVARYWVRDETYFVASVGNGTNGDDSHQRAKQNAQLISAAPSLLASLKECQELLALVARPAKGTENMPSLLSQALVAEANARAAIEKAEPK